MKRYNKEIGKNVRGNNAPQVRADMTPLSRITEHDLRKTELLSPTEIKEGIAGVTKSFIRAYTGLTVHYLERLTHGEKTTPNLDSLRRISFFLKEFKR